MNKNLEEIKKYIAENQEKFPLSYKNLTYKINKEEFPSIKIVHSEKFKDKDFTVSKFFKPISRLF